MLTPPVSSQKLSIGQRDTETENLIISIQNSNIRKTPFTTWLIIIDWKSFKITTWFTTLVYSHYTEAC